MSLQFLAQSANNPDVTLLFKQDDPHFISSQQYKNQMLAENAEQVTDRYDDFIRQHPIHISPTGTFTTDPNITTNCDVNYARQFQELHFAIKENYSEVIKNLFSQDPVDVSTAVDAENPYRRHILEGEQVINALRQQGVLFDLPESPEEQRKLCITLSNPALRKKFIHEANESTRQILLQNFPYLKETREQFIIKTCLSLSEKNSLDSKKCQECIEKGLATPEEIEKLKERGAQYYQDKLRQAKERMNNAYPFLMYLADQRPHPYIETNSQNLPSSLYAPGPDATFQWAANETSLKKQAADFIYSINEHCPEAIECAMIAVDIIQIGSAIATGGWSAVPGAVLKMGVSYAISYAIQTQIERISKQIGFPLDVVFALGVRAQFIKAFATHNIPLLKRTAKRLNSYINKNRPPGAGPHGGTLATAHGGRLDSANPSFKSTFEVDNVYFAKRELLGTVEKIGKNYPRNAEYAGKTFYFTGELAKKYPNGVKFNEKGFPDFTPYAEYTVKLDKIKSYKTDQNAALQQLRKQGVSEKELKKLDKKYVLHHYNGPRNSDSELNL